MTRSKLRAWTWLYLPVSAPLLVLVALKRFDTLDVPLRSSAFHLVVVSAIAGCALGVAIVAGRAGTRLAHAGPVWLALGCLCVGLLMFAHGLLTPGVLGRPANEWVGRTPYLAITAFTAALALASRPRNSAASRLAAAHPRRTLLVPTTLLAVLLAAVVVEPRALAGASSLPAEEQLHWAVLVLDSLVLAALVLLHWRRWRLGHDIVQLALMLAAAMSIAALVSLRLGEMWRVSWWDYHGYLLAGFGGAVYAVWARFRHTRAVEQVLAATFEDDPMAHIVSGYPDALRMLVRAVEVKDAYTHGHSQRTACIAVQLGQRLRLDEDTLRAIARGGYLHDVGKIAIPDEVLNKPGRLDPAERAVIETHPRVGYELVKPQAELREALPTVLHHHERWDGTGYPGGLEGHEIPLVARIVAVADVWDALTSDRAYRPGMTPQLALAHIAAGSGSHFQPELVDAFLGLAAEWGYAPASVEVDEVEGWLAAQTCHAVGASRA